MLSPDAVYVLGIVEQPPKSNVRVSRRGSRQRSPRPVWSLVSWMVDYRALSEFSGFEH